MRDKEILEDATLAAFKMEEEMEMAPSSQGAQVASWELKGNDLSPKDSKTYAALPTS